MTLALCLLWVVTGEIGHVNPLGSHVGYRGVSGVLMVQQLHEMASDQIFEADWLSLHSAKLINRESLVPVFSSMEASTWPAPTRLLTMSRAYYSISSRLSTENSCAS
jgi:hypothetical protein